MIDFFDEISFDEGGNEIDELVLKYSRDRGGTWLPEADRIFVSSMQPTFKLTPPDGAEPIRSGDLRCASRLLAPSEPPCTKELYLTPDPTLHSTEVDPHEKEP